MPVVMVCLGKLTMPAKTSQRDSECCILLRGQAHTDADAGSGLRVKATGLCIRPISPQTAGKKHQDVDLQNTAERHVTTIPQLPFTIPCTIAWRGRHGTLEIFIDLSDTDHQYG